MMEPKNSPGATQTANYIIRSFQEHGELITNLKLQKLLYYAQGWYLALDGETLFSNQIEAWVHGPVVPDIYRLFKKYKYAPITDPVNEINLSQRISEHLNEIIDVYGSYSAFELESLTHETDPWKEARGSIPCDEPSSAIITVESMRAYFIKKMAEDVPSKNS